MRRILFSLTFISFIFSSFNILAQGEKQQILDYLDSCTTYLQKRRPDLVVQFNLKADHLASVVDDLPFETLFQIQNNYIWAFDATKRYKLKNVHLKKQLDLIEKERAKGASHFVVYQIAIGNTAAAFKYNNQLDSAGKYYERAIQLATENKDDIYLAGALNNMGIFIAEGDDWETAKEYFDKAIQTLETNEKFDSTLYYSIQDNLADYYFNSNDSLRAIHLVETNLKELQLNKRTGEKLLRWGQKLLRCYINYSAWEKADSLIHQLKNMVPGIMSSRQYAHMAKLIRQEVEVLDRMGENQKSDSLKNEYNSFLQKYILFLKERNTSMDQLLLEYTAQSTDQEMRIAQQEIEEAERKAHRNRVLLIVSLIVFTIVILLLWTNYKRRIQLEHRDNELKEKQLEIESLEKEKIQIELENKSKDFTNLIMQNTLQEDWSEYLIGKLKSIGSKDKEAANDELKELTIELRQKTSMYKKIHELHKGMDEANTSFYKKLKARFPKLTKAEKETCGLIRMNMQSKEIALIRNISPSSVRKLRQRIRGKLELGADQDLYAFIQNL